MSAAAAGGNTRVGWFFINLDRSADRCATMLADAGALGVTLIRVPAVDGAHLRLPMPGIDPAVYWRVHGRTVRPSEVGCYLSHIKAFQAVAAHGCDYAMVMEDDIVLNRDAVDLAAALTAPGARDDWDVIKFEAHHKGPAFPLRRLAGDYRLCALPTRSQGAAAYLVSRHAAMVLLERLLPMVVPYDHAFDRGWAMGLRIRAIVPYPLGTRPGEISTITDSPPVKVRLHQKLPTLWWRTRNEIMRVLSALHARIAPTKPFPVTLRAQRGSEALLTQLAEVLGETS